MISIIVPVYNCKNFIKQSVDSVLAQTIEDWELILVDDGSSDGTTEALDELAKTDGRIKIIHKENGGASTARNAGLDIATGEFIGFMDADDLIEPDFYEKLIKGFDADSEKNPIDFVISGVIEEKGDGIFTTIMPNYKLYDRDALWQDFLNVKKGGMVRQSIWNKLFRAGLFENIRFMPGVIGEDIEILYQLINKAKGAVSIPYAGYHYKLNDNSVTHIPLNEKTFCMSEITNEKIEFVRENAPGFLANAYAYDMKQQTNILQRLLFAPNRKDFYYKKKTIIKRIRRDLRKTFGKPVISFSNRMLGVLAVTGLFKPVRVLVKKFNR